MKFDTLELEDMKNSGPVRVLIMRPGKDEAVTSDLYVDVSLIDRRNCRGTYTYL